MRVNSIFRAIISLKSGLDATKEDTHGGLAESIRPRSPNRAV